MQGRNDRLQGGPRRIFVASIGVLAVLLAMQGAFGASILSNNNSTISLNLNSSAGMTSWTVDGNNDVNQQWFWFRIGNGPQFDISTISAPSISTLGTKQLTAVYNNSLYSVTISYQLTGGSLGSGHSALTEQINFSNLSPSTPLDLHFFMYSDFTLGGAPYANSQNVALGTGTDFSTAVQTVSGTGFSNTIAMPFSPPNHVEAGISPQLFNELTSSSGYTLNGVQVAGPGHVSWGMEWDASLGVLGSTNSSLGTISITDTLQVPEPVTPALALLGLGLGLGVWRRSKKSST